MMRRLLVLLVALLLPVQGWALTLVQSGCQTGNLYAGTTQYVYPYPATPTAGNLVVIATAQETRSVNTIAGTSTSYTINGTSSIDSSGSQQRATIHYAIFSGSDTTATITLNGTTAITAAVCFSEWSAANSDQSGNTANGFATTAGAVAAHNSGSVTPPTANNVVVAFYYRSGAAADFTEDGAFTSISTGSDNYYYAYLLQSAATAQEYNSTSSPARFSAMRIGSFAGTAGGGGGGSTTTPNFFRGRLQVNP